MRYCMGDQWSDTIRVYHHGYWEEMTERTYMEKRNQTPMSNNIMVSILESIAGLYAKQGTEPVCFARDSDSRQLSDMMSVTMQCNWQTTYMQDVLNHAIKDYLMGGQMFVRESWEAKELEMPDSWTDAMEPDHMFFECGSDPRHNDVSLIGVLHDVSREDLYQKFAKQEYGLTEEDLNAIFDIYPSDDNSYGYEFNEEKALENLCFDHSNKGRHYSRVIEVWTTETKPRLQCFDQIALRVSLCVVGALGAVFGFVADKDFPPTLSDFAFGHFRDDGWPETPQADDAIAPRFHPQPLKVGGEVFPDDLGGAVQRFAVEVGEEHDLLCHLQRRNLIPETKPDEVGVNRNQAFAEFVLASLSLAQSGDFDAGNAVDFLAVIDVDLGQFVRACARVEFQQRDPAGGTPFHAGERAGIKNRFQLVMRERLPAG